MKKTWTIVCIILCIAVLAAVFTSCKKEEEQPEEAGIIVTFVTGFENDNLIVDPIRITEKTPGTLPEDPRHAGYDFTGWYYDAARTQKFTTSDVLKADTILYAGWSQKRSGVSVSGEGEQIVAPNGLAYILVNEEYVVTGYVGDATSITVPASYLGKNVTAFGDNAFGENDTLETIEFSAGIESIERTAFIGLTALKNVNVTSSDHFYSVNGLLFNRAGTELVVVGQGRTNAFTLPATVKKIGENAFYGCSFDVTVAETCELTVLDSYAFTGYKGQLTLSSKVAEIRKKAFFESTCSIVFPTNCAILSLGNGEFDGYKGETLRLPGSITSVSGSPFYGSTAAIDFSATGVTTLGPSAMAGYAGEEFVVPFFVREIEENCFYRCTAKVTFDDRTTYSTIRELSFNQFLGDIVFPATVRTIEKNAFCYIRKNYATVRFSSRRSEIAIDPNAFLSCAEENFTFAQ